MGRSSYKCPTGTQTITHVFQSDDVGMLSITQQNLNLLCWISPILTYNLQSNQNHWNQMQLGEFYNLFFNIISTLNLWTLVMEKTINILTPLLQLIKQSELPTQLNYKNHKEVSNKTDVDVYLPWLHKPCLCSCAHSACRWSKSPHQCLL